MKMLFSALVVLTASVLSYGQGKNAVADIRAGTVNHLTPADEHAVIKKKFPRYAAETVISEQAPNECMIGVFYDKHGFRFYTQAGYIEITKDFTGTESIPLLGKSMAEADKVINREEIKTETSQDNLFVFYKTDYGCLVLKLKDDRVERYYLCHKAADMVSPCFLF